MREVVKFPVALGLLVVAGLELVFVLLASWVGKMVVPGATMSPFTSPVTFKTTPPSAVTGKVVTGSVDASAELGVAVVLLVKDRAVVEAAVESPSPARIYVANPLLELVADWQQATSSKTLQNIRMCIFLRDDQAHRIVHTLRS